MLISPILFAQDSLVEELKAENALLENQIERNNRIIRSRVGTSSEVEVPEADQPEIRKTIFNLGLTNLRWKARFEQNNDFETIAPSIGLAIGIKNSWIEGGNVRAHATNFPSDGQSSLLNIYKLTLGHNVVTADNGVLVQLLAGFSLNALESRGTRNIADSRQSKIENEEVDEIEEKDGAFGGIAIGHVWDGRWMFTIKTELIESEDILYTLQLGFFL